mgnify:CR=1 FL=1
MSILDQIVADKKIEVAQRKSLFPSSFWEASPLFERPTLSLTKRLQASPSGIIAEHKRRSPSKQNINSSLTVSEVAKGYDCGIQIKNYNDLKEGDIIEGFQQVEIKKKLK